MLALLALAGCADAITTGSASLPTASVVDDAPAERKRVRLPKAKEAELTRVALATAPESNGVATGSLAPQGEEFDVVTVMWGTNRAKAKPPAPAASATGSLYPPSPRFSSQRSTRLTTGYAKITVPKKRRQVGEIPRPTEYTLLNVTLYKANEDPRAHFTIGDLSTLSRSEFAAFADAVGRRATHFKGHAFIYVHGYWNTFEDSLYRTAQLAYDMGFDGVPYAYSWPSQGDARGYLYDKDSVDGSQKPFLEFLKLVASETHASKVHIIAHSMGSRLVVDTLFPQIGQSRLAALPNVGQIILAAADIDASVLQARAAAIGESVQTLTLYASNSDEALIASKRLAGNQPRAGEIVNGAPLIMKGVETIDISQMSTWVFLGRNHGKYAEKAHVLKDIALIMETGVHPPDVRFPVFASVSSPQGVYWRYVSN